MNNGRFVSTLSSSEQERLSQMIEEFSRQSAMGNKKNYELVSKQRAVISRAKMRDLTDAQKFDLRMYGRFGLTINRALRKSHIEHIDTIPLTELRKSRFRNIDTMPLTVANWNIEQFKTRAGRPSTVDDITRDTASVELSEKDLIRSFRVSINNIIDEHEAAFSRNGYVYRISRARRGIYVTEREAEHVNVIVKPGDILMDDAFWSSTSDPSVALHRYSAGPGGAHASNQHAIAADEEEILYVIENNDNLKSIDISGFKLTDKDTSKDAISSGEMLMKSNTKFRVMGIENTRPNMDRRIVILKPETEIASLFAAESRHAECDIIKNPYDGESIS